MAPPLSLDDPTKLLNLLYDDLRELAGAYLQRERRNHTLQPTALVHEAYLRLSRASFDAWKNKEHFYAGAARMMRRVLVDHARAARAAKRERPDARDPIMPLITSCDDGVAIDVLTLDAALEELRALDARKASVVELKFFAGLEVAEIARILMASDRTVEREWTFARCWLRARVSGGEVA